MARRTLPDLPNPATPAEGQAPPPEGEHPAEDQPQEPQAQETKEDITPAVEVIPAETEGAEEVKEAAPEADSGTTAPPTEPQFPPALLNRAVEMGWTVQDAKTFGSAESLERALNVQDRKWGQMLMQRQQPPAQPAAETPTVPQPQAPSAAPVVPPLVPDFKVELNPEEVDEKVIGTFRGMQEWQRSHHETVAQNIQRLQQVVTGLGTMLTVNYIDQQIAALGPDWEPVFGAGSTFDLNPQSPAAQSRAQVRKAFEIMNVAGQMPGRTPAGGKELFQRALLTEFADHHQKLVNKRATQQANTSRQRTTMPPTARKQAEPETGRVPALKAMRQYRREHGIPEEW